MLVSDQWLYSNHLNTEFLVFKWEICVRLSNGRIVSGCKMVELCPVVKWSGIQMVETEKNYVYGPKCPVFWMARQVTWLYHLNTGHPNCPVFRWIWYSGVRYSDGYFIYPDQFLRILPDQHLFHWMISWLSFWKFLQSCRQWSDLAVHHRALHPDWHLHSRKTRKIYYYCKRDLYTERNWIPD